MRSINVRAVVAGHVTHHQPAAASTAATLSDTMDQRSQRGIFIDQYTTPGLPDHCS